MSQPSPSPDELRSQLASLDSSLAQLTAAGVPEAALAALRQQADTVRQLLVGAGVQAGGDVNVGGDVVRDKIGTQVNTGGGPYYAGPVTVVPKSNEPQDLLAAYLAWLRGACCNLPLGPIDTNFVRTTGEQSVSLADIYIDLDVMTPSDEGRRSGEGKKPAARAARRTWTLQLMRGESGADRIRLLQVLADPEASHVVLLGEAGSGKTTFVNYLAYLLASGSSDAPEALHGLLPVRLALRDVAARHIPGDATRGEAQWLWEALRTDIAACLGKDAADELLPYLKKRLWAEGGCFLFDGLDEVPTAAGRRQRLLEAVTEFMRPFEKTRARFIVTARPYAYADPRTQLQNTRTLFLASFSEEQVGRFIARFYQAVRPVMGWNEETARRNGDKLRVALDERPYLGDLASRPLLLTLMATLNASWGRLPEDRADLYEETVRLLLGRWKNDIATLGIAEERIRPALEALAFTVHERQGGQAEQRDDAPADITRAELVVAFETLLGVLKTEDLIEFLRYRAGLLVERDEGVYSFPHRSFQEYLAGCRLANQLDAAKRLRKLAQDDIDWWREVCLLAIGKQWRGSQGGAANLVQALIPASPDEVTAITDQHWRLAALAGQALVELRPNERGAQEDFAVLLRRSQCWLRKLVEGGHLTARVRAAAGDVLGQLGDPRPGVATIMIGETEAPDILWVRVPAGPFTMGSSADDDQAYADERPAHALTLPEFYISRYPITNAQYGLFVAAGGYEDLTFWTPEGWAWRQGAEADLSPIDDEDFRKRYAEWLKNRPTEKRNGPYWWGDPKWGKATRPVVGVSRYEALAYCTWLRSRLAQVTVPFSVWHEAAPVTRPLSWQSAGIRLPSEAEWEKAARGVKGLRWPWGNAWQKDRANTEEAGLGETSAVGVFPQGASPYGVLDMSGNVWEWTRSRWGQRSVYAPDYGYPYQFNDGREEPDGPDLCVVRGGSWNNNRRNARCVFRFRNLPDIFGTNIGFRVVVSLSASGF